MSTKQTTIAGLVIPITVANGGTGQTTAQAAIDAITNVAGATNEHVLTKDTATGNAVFKATSSSSGAGEALTKYLLCGGF